MLAAVAATENRGPKRLISGRVIDKQSGEALAGVRVQVRGSDIVSYTDFEGNYTLLADVKPRTEVELVMAGYASLTLNVSEISVENDAQLIPR